MTTVLAVGATSHTQTDWHAINWQAVHLAIYAPSVTYLTATRTALMTNDRAGAIRITLELLGVLTDTDLHSALHAAIAALDAEGRAGLADPLRWLVG